MGEGFTLVFLHPFRSPDSCSSCGVRKSWSGIRKYESRGEGKKICFLFTAICWWLVRYRVRWRSEGDSRKWLRCECTYAKERKTRGVERKSPQVCWQSGDVSRKSALVFAKTWERTFVPPGLPLWGYRVFRDKRTRFRVQSPAAAGIKTKLPFWSLSRGE